MSILRLTSLSLLINFLPILDDWATSARLSLIKFHVARAHGIRRMKIIVDGRKVGNSDDACYYDYIAYFKKRKLNKRNVLHEYFHHLAFVYDLELSDSREEREANRYSRMLRKWS
jgi:hypothetical protein